MSVLKKQMERKKEMNKYRNWYSKFKNVFHTRIKEIYALCINERIYIYKNTTIFNILYVKY